MKPRIALVIEQTLGHVAHTRNLEAAVAANPWVDASVVKLGFDAFPFPTRVIPGGRNWSLRASLMARRALQAQAARGRLDGIFIHTQVAALLSVGLMSRVPTVISLDATPIDFDAVGPAYQHRSNGSLVEAMKLRVNRRALRNATALVTWSRQAANTLTARYDIEPWRISVIRPGVDLARFGQVTERPPSETFRVLFVGGDFRRKGGYDLLDAMRRLHPSAELDVVTAAQPPGLAPGPRCRVHVGLTPGSERLLELYARADVFVLPTLGDCFPQVLAEAAASGLPIVATSTGAIGEVVRSGVNGLLIPPGAPAELAAALTLLRDNPQLRWTMGQESLRLAREEHDALRNNTRILELVARSGRRTRAAGGAAPVRG